MNLKVFADKRVIGAIAIIAVAVAVAFGGDKGKEYACKAADFLSVEVDLCQPEAATN